MKFYLKFNTNPANSNYFCFPWKFELAGFYCTPNQSFCFLSIPRGLLFAMKIEGIVESLNKLAKKFLKDSDIKGGQICPVGKSLFSV